jgi:HEAT repeat protein
MTMTIHRALAVALLWGHALAHAATCPPAQPQSALPLLECLSDPNPRVRDDHAFSGLQKMMRAGQLDASTVQAMRVRLLAMLRGPDPAGFTRPFAALTLAEVARIDRIKPFLTAEQRNELVDAAAAYLSGVTDYRGFDEREGWRHGVAHGADLMLQLALNPQLQHDQAEAMRTAIAKQVVPAGDHFYRYGEGERLAAPVFYLARRDFFSPEEWELWLAKIVARVPREPHTQAALAARHNVIAFLSALYISVREAGDEKTQDALLPALRKALRELG